VVKLKGQHAYLDANTVIYAIEGYTKYTNLRAGLLAPLDNGEFTAVTSLITLVETVVGARKVGDAATETDYRDFLTPSANFSIEPVSLPVLEKVIELRAQYGLKIPDAIHLATGLLAVCTVFVTRDASWARTGVSVVEPQDIV
jgi:predicted nucleic acid-binding protein